MAPASNEDQFKFLISCIRYSNNGKVRAPTADDSTDRLTLTGRLYPGRKGVQHRQQGRSVSNILTIFFQTPFPMYQAEFLNHSAKRYERMMKAHGIAPNAASVRPSPARTPKTECRDSAPASSSKKRKADAFIEDNAGADDEEGFGNIKSERGGNIKEEKYVKEEHEQSQLSLDDATNLMHYYDAQVNYGGAQLGIDEGCGSEYGGSSAGYATPMGGAFGMHGQDDFGFSGSLYTAAGMSAIPRSEGQNLHYQPMMRYPSENEGRSDSPVVVD
jgi:hypothetical protein